MQIFSALNSKYIPHLKEKWQHVGFQKYFQNTSWMFFGRFFTLGVSFFIGIYIARYLGPSNYGLLSYVISFVGLFSFLTSFGIDGIVSREIIKDHNKKDDLIGTAFYLKILGSIIAIITVFLVSIFTTKDIFILGLIWIFSLSFIPQAFNVVETYFQSQVLSKNSVKAQIISLLLASVLKIICIVLNKGIFWLTLIYVIEGIIYSFILLILYRKFGKHIRDWRFQKDIAISLLKDSWPLMLASVAIGIYMKIDQVMIKNMLGNEQTGIYAVAVKLSEVWYFLPGIICASLFPALVNSLKNSEEFLNQRIKKLYFLMFWFSFLIALVTTTFAYPIIKILFGSQYLGAVTVLQIYIWASISVFLSYTLNYYLLSKNFTKILFYNTVIGAVINIILNFLLIPKFGINGSATATIISYIAVTFGILFFNKTREHGLLLLKSIINYK